MRHVAALAVAMLALAAPAAAQAPQSYAASATASYQYRTRSGDTLPRIAAAYLTSRAAALEVGRLNNISGPARIAPGTTLAIPTVLLRTEPLNAKVIAYRGDVRIGREGLTRRGMVFGEGIRIVTGANSSVAFQLGDRSVVTLPSLSTIRIMRLRRVLISNRAQRVLTLESGRVESEVTPSRDRSTSFEIRTPVSVAAVRGTEFRVSYADDQHAATAEVLKGAVGVDGKTGGVGLDAGYGARSDEQSAGTAIALLPPPEIQGPVRNRRDGTLIFAIADMDEAVAYRLTIAGDQQFHDLRSETLSRTSQAVVPSLPDGTYHVRATAIDAHGLEGKPADMLFDHHQAGPPRAGSRLPRAED